MCKKGLEFLFLLGLLVSHQRTLPVVIPNAIFASTVAATAGCLGFYGAYKLYNHFYDFTLKDAQELLNNIQEFEQAGESIATTDINYETWLLVSEPLVHHVMKLTGAIRDCEHYTERINYGLPILEKKAAKQHECCKYGDIISAMRNKTDELACLKVKLQEIITQIKQNPKYEQEQLKYENKKLKEQVANLEKELCDSKRIIEDSKRIIFELQKRVECLSNIEKII